MNSVLAWLGVWSLASRLAAADRFFPAPRWHGAGPLRALGSCWSSWLRGGCAGGRSIPGSTCWRHRWGLRPSIWPLPFTGRSAAGSGRVVGLPWACAGAQLAHPARPGSVPDRRGVDRSGWGCSGLLVAGRPLPRSQCPHARAVLAEPGLWAGRWAAARAASSCPTSRAWSRPPRPGSAWAHLPAMLLAAGGLVLLPLATRRSARDLLLRLCAAWHPGNRLPAAPLPGPDRRGSHQQQPHALLAASVDGPDLPAPGPAAGQGAAPASCCIRARCP